MTNDKHSTKLVNAVAAFFTRSTQEDNPSERSPSMEDDLKAAVAAIGVSAGTVETQEALITQVATSNRSSKKE